MTFIGSFNASDTEHVPHSLRTLFDFLPNLRHLKFKTVLTGIPSTVWDICVERIASIDIDYYSRWKATKNPILRAPLYTPRNACSQLALGSNSWRELHSQFYRFNLSAEYAAESHHLTQLVCGMNNTAESLALPMETAPLVSMSQLSWPRIKNLSLQGRYPSDMQSTTLPAVLSRMPTLRSLRIQAAQRDTFLRPRIWEPSMAPLSSAL